MEKIFKLIDGKKSWMDIIDIMEKVYGWKREKTDAKLSKLKKKGVIWVQPRRLPLSTTI
jgi:hypothetical protein